MLLLLCLCCGPAIAEIPDPPRTVEVHYIEVNRWEQSDGNYFDQVVFWRVDYLRVERRYVTVDCGWCYQKAASLIEVENGWACWVPERDTVYVAPECYWSVTSYDPEMMYREHAKW